MGQGDNGKDDQALHLTDISKDGVEMVEKSGLAVGVTPHLDVVDGVAQDAGGAKDEAQTQVTYNKDNGRQLGHCILSIECTKSNHNPGAFAFIKYLVEKLL